MKGIEREWSLIRMAWGNGQRGLLIASMLFAAAMVVLAAAIIGSLCSPGPYAPIEDINPQTVVKVTATTVEVAAIKCNHSGQDVGVEGKKYWRNMETQELIYDSEGVGIRQPGCRTLEYVNRIPKGVTAGTWRIEGVEIARAGNEEQREPWYTQSFEVEGGQHE